MNTLARFLSISALYMVMGTSQAVTLDEGVRELQQQWAIAKYKTQKPEQDKAFETLTAKAKTLTASFDDRAEPKIWQAIIVSTHAGIRGGLGALSMVKEARSLLEDAEKIDATALQGSAYTSLGSLYYQVPGWPLGFGDDAKAESYLKKALALNPDGIDPNYFYGDLLREEGRYREAAKYLEKALQAPDRPNRSMADAGRRKEAREALEAVKAKLTIAEN
jgi:tetratricopeptide (TPR) repeat protein